MKIGIDGSRAFMSQRTGIEEYSYQVIRHLREKLAGHQIFLYLRNKQTIDFELPENWITKVINFPRFWTQVGLSMEMLSQPVDVLFVPGHTVPWFHPKNTIVTIHGLEYEMMPEAYSAWERFYMRCSIKNSCKWAEKIICVSQNTKQDLMDLYGVSEEKINIIHEGYNNNFQFPISNFQTTSNKQALKIRNNDIEKPYLLFIGRLEKRKNICGIISAFEILKEKYGILHKLVLAGKFGFGEKEIREKMEQSKYKNEIILTGFVSEDEKWKLLKSAAVFVFPSYYEGFGLPVLEAQSVGIPVVASKTSSLPEIVNDSALLVDPDEAEFMAKVIFSLIDNEKLCNKIIERGYGNINRFSWERCANLIEKILQ